MSEWKNSEIGLIPKNWSINKADNYCLRVTDGTHDTPKPQKEGKYLITSKHIIGGRIDLSSAYKISIEDFDAVNLRSKVEQWDILYSMIGTVGETALVEEGTVDFAIKNIGLFKCGKEIKAHWLKYYFRSPLAIYHLKSRLSGTTQKYITLGELRSFPILYPENQEEQKSIVSILSSLDSKIDLLRRQNETLEAIVQTLFKRWFVEFEFPDENGRPYKSSGGKMVSSELGEIPEWWNISKVVKEIQIIGGGTPSTKEPSYWENGTINWYTPSDLTSNNELYSSGSGRKITEKGLSNSSATLFPEYSLLMTSRATIGEIAINTNKACTNQGFIILIPNNSYPVYFLHGWLLEQLNIIRRLASGSTFPEINRSEFKNFDILKIPIETMNVYKKIVTPIYRKIENNIRESKSLKITRDTLLPKLMSGQIRVN